jgi:hypothetical protein
MGRELDTTLQQRDHRPLLSEGGGYREARCDEDDGKYSRTQDEED